MKEDTVTVDGQEYIFQPDQVCKPQKQTEKNDKVIFKGENR